MPEGVVPETGIEPVRPLSGAADFKSAVSANFTTRACPKPRAERVRKSKGSGGAPRKLLKN